MGAMCCCFNCPTFFSTGFVVAALFGMRQMPLEYFLPMVCVPAGLYALFGERTKMTRLRNKVVLVTGASSGLGKALSIEASKRGCQKIILVARSEDKLKETAAECMMVKRNPQLKTVVETCDLFKIEDMKRLAAKVTQEHGALDLLVNNAGQGEWKWIEDTTPEDALRMMACPYQSAISLTSLFIPEMVKAQTGHVMNVTSVVSMTAIRGCVGYGAARWAVRGFTKMLYWDCKEINVGVTLLSPAEIEGTDYFKNAPGKAGGDSHNRIPLLFKMVGWLGLNYTTKGTAWAGMNAVENGYAIANTPAHVSQAWVILQSCMPWFSEILGGLGRAGVRGTKKIASIGEQSALI